MKKIILLCIFVLIVIVGVVVLFGQKEHILPEETKTIPDSQSTTAFTNSEYGFSFMYPTKGESDYVIATSSDQTIGNQVFSASVFSTSEYDSFKETTSATEPPPSLTIEVFSNPTNMALETWIKSNKLSNFDLSTEKTIKTVTLGNNQFLLYQWDGLYRSNTYAYLQDGYVYLFANMYADTNSSMRKDMEVVLGSLHFITPKKITTTANSDITVSLPVSGTSISSPVHLEGKAKGTWFFEASFPAELLNQNGEVIAQQPVQADGDWMTENFVAFNADLEFPQQPSGEKGTLILKKDNPSGLPENDASIKIPIIFK